jgi:membrane peptidoglycan carboxypeptidase
MRTDGSVLARVGGRDYGQSQFNRATQAERQPGSSFKPFVYLAAFRAGATPDTLVLDAPIRIGGWSPENHESHYANAPITLRQAFAKSSNVAAVRLEQQVGIGAVQRAARDLGVTAPLPNDMTLALGSANLTLLQLTSAYAGIAAGAAPVTPRGLLKQPPSATHPVLRPAEQQAMLQLMSAVINGGTGSAANPGVPAFGKTGTSQDYRDAYFIGFVGDLVIGVWIGNDDNSSMNRVVGGMLPAQIWRQVMTYALAHGQAKAAAAQVQAAEIAPAPEAGSTEPIDRDGELAPPLSTDDDRPTGYYRTPRPRERLEPPPAPQGDDRGGEGAAAL